MLNPATFRTSDRRAYSPARCLTNFPSGLHSACTFLRSSEVKSAPASSAVSPLRLICITPTTFSSFRIGALIILWMDSPVVVAAFTPSNTEACRTAENALFISGRLSRAVRAASAELLDNGMNPTFFSAAGAKKCKCLQRLETPSIATSSARTPRSFAIRSATEGREFSAVVEPSESNAAARRSNSETRLVLIDFRLSSQHGKLWNGFENLRRPESILRAAHITRKKFSKCLFLPPHSAACTDFVGSADCRILSVPRFHGALILRSSHKQGIQRRRGHVLHDNPA